MARSVARQLIDSHLVEGDPTPGREIGLKIDQTLTQDATGTMVMLELEAMGLERVRTEVSVQYIDHNLLQTDHKNPDDHLFLRSACRRFGVWYSRPGNGVSHPVHQQRFGIPGKTLVGSDSHTPAAGAIGMLAFGAGGLEVALAMAGEPLYVTMPRIWGIRLSGTLPEWVSAKDVILEMLRRHGVGSGKNRILEYHGPGLACLSAMDRHVIANMGTELGATTTIFPSDEETRRFLKSQGRETDWVEITADEDAPYDLEEEIDLSLLEPLIALPSSPGNVVPVREVAGAGIYQSYIGSSANPGLRDFAIAARMVAGRKVPEHVSFDINPTSRQLLENLIEMDLLAPLVKAGARIHQTGCNGCIGMGQAPATNEISLRTVPRNFPGRSGTKEDKVYLVSPETAAASALTGVITDPRTLGMRYPRLTLPEIESTGAEMLEAPPEDGTHVKLRKGPNIESLPKFAPLPGRIEAPVLLKVGDDVSTDEIMPAGAEVLPFRSNIPKISEFVFWQIDDSFHHRALAVRETTGCLVVGGRNYGQGSSREHAALAPRYLGLHAVIAIEFARIHWQNLVNFGVLPLTFTDPADYARIEQGDVLALPRVRAELASGIAVTVENRTRGFAFPVEHELSPRQVEMILTGSLIGFLKSRLDRQSPEA
ncbi:MAG TPA: aconitate hydratase [Gemmatimonadota bacterium]|nr:aconitate hydratase [Gemmatimonadota bacterium]